MKKPTFSTPERQSMGILDDFAQRKNVETRNIHTTTLTADVLTTSGLKLESGTNQIIFDSDNKGKTSTLNMPVRTLNNALHTFQNPTGVTSFTIYESGGQDVSVIDGGTGRSLATKFCLIAGNGATDTGAHTSIANDATSNKVLLSKGSLAFPAWNTAAGISVTITTAQLTALGAQGSMTFTNGILSAQTQAT